MPQPMGIRYHLRFFAQVTCVSSGNKHFFTKPCHRQTYQNYEQPPRTSQDSDFQSNFSVWKIFVEEYWTRRPIY